MSKEKGRRQKMESEINKEFVGYFPYQMHGFISIQILFMMNGLLLHHLGTTDKCSPSQQQAM